ncbi:MAG: divalent metal cation transporter [Candidatus Kapabacteria bacterium]|nr:divalent metal cation transporter [Candidatus Kapabacteria bacterium]
MKNNSTTSRTTALAGAAFLMATSAIGPGFLTQTAVFTQKLGADFAVVIALSTFLDIAAQLTIWRVIAASRLRAQDIANKVVPGSGLVLALVVAMGGFLFNIGNVAGAGLGMMSATGISVETGAVISAAMAAALFLLPEAGKAMDRFAQVMGGVMLLLMLYVAVIAKAPLWEALTHAFMPGRVDVLATMTLVGGTVGGYITFAGGHRLVDAGITGAEAIPRVTASATAGIIVTACMRCLLFVAALGVVSGGGVFDAGNPAASVFSLTLGSLGMKLFGVVMWSAAITSIVGSAYTSVSFVRTLSPTLEKYQKYVVVGFILLSATVFLIFGKPVQVLIFAGLANSFVVPFALVLMLVAAYKREIVGAYRHPLWLALAGGLVALLLFGMSFYAVFG